MRRIVVCVAMFATVAACSNPDEAASNETTTVGANESTGSTAKAGSSECDQAGVERLRAATPENHLGEGFLIDESVGTAFQFASSVASGDAENAFSKVSSEFAEHTSLESLASYAQGLSEHDFTVQLLGFKPFEDGRYYEIYFVLAATDQPPEWFFEVTVFDAGDASVPSSQRPRVFSYSVDALSSSCPDGLRELMAVEGTGAGTTESTVLPAVDIPIATFYTGPITSPDEFEKALRSFETILTEAYRTEDTSLLAFVYSPETNTADNQARFENSANFHSTNRHRYAEELADEDSYVRITLQTEPGSYEFAGRYAEGSVSAIVDFQERIYPDFDVYPVANKVGPLLWVLAPATVQVFDEVSGGTITVDTWLASLYQRPG